MDREQMEEFYSVRESAYEALRCRTLIEQPRSVSVCQFLILPSFENPVSWDVFRVSPRRAATEMRLFRSTWRMDVDEQAMSSPVERLKHPRPYPPTLQTDSVPVDAVQLDAVLLRIRSICIPLLVTEPPMGLDGTSFELAVGALFCNARIRWWCNLPKEWHELTPVVAELWRLFESDWQRGRG